MTKRKTSIAVLAAWAALVAPAHAQPCDEEDRLCAPATGAADYAVCTAGNLAAYEGPLKEIHGELDDCLRP